MTDKQRKLLQRYLDDGHIKVLSSRGPYTVSDFINLIIQTTDKSSRYLNHIPVLERQYTAEEYKRISDMLHRNREKFGALEGEYLGTTNEVSYIYNGPTWYTACMTWSKGSGNTVSRIPFRVTEEGKCPLGVYDILVDMGIFSIGSLLDYCRQSMQELSDEKHAPIKPEKCNMATMCPECGTNWKRCYAYCPGCGRKIDWGGETNGNDQRTPETI
ncbi:hypothetical protein [Cuneatibacter caecimuris]|uniref:Uncharacterized protein n=1 Tax=Cuneatibacter caecimuris TaxID=1796618 RepID=A0A4Q7PPH6_9FIRM|nr:hypothetical protein [Cuneatibacter caecimuris]RZT02919.1 hypothetical protein EV209_1049 [Cuneatibacter caecimuris]